ncbi:anaerobic ribonucleoside-triphosphate reductase activating protein [Eubacterium sp. 14-2]|uniref:anaerobic ribonucleoside-triphosphate reductase activating protein n=1 Tax=Eubacterium sp. 14-2 TaxID=1235790 RepID=UPI000339CB5A|nr:anaerobic ribonucleoside-triphosphate reductase activating protein [Eubacterium sp. 14-2]EOT24157.1 anaerobic ribonucleoside-triphosphate reductase activating protein [Eubacterium sp. 14-2]
MRYHDITKDDMLNGDGLRVVLWVSGCSHCCKECQNPITWDPNGGLLFDEKAKEEIFAELARDYISGITFSGGDPLYSGNRSDVLKLAREIKERFPGKTIWMYTGFVWETIADLEIMKYVDILVDGEFQVEQKDTGLYWRGSSNQRVINVPVSRAEGKAVLHCE